jgi:hypothetical protein
MGSFSIWHVVILILPIAVIAFFFWMIVRILRKAGYSGGGRCSCSSRS